MYSYFYYKKPVNLLFVSKRAQQASHWLRLPGWMWHIVLLQSKRNGVADISTTDVYATSL